MIQNVAKNRQADLLYHHGMDIQCLVCVDRGVQHRVLEKIKFHDARVCTDKPDERLIGIIESI